MSDVNYTDRNAKDDGTIVDLLQLGVRVHLNGRPVTRMTATLFDAFKPHNPGGPEIEQAAAYTALLGYALVGIADDAGPGEPRGFLFTTPGQPGLGGRPIWAQPNDDGFTVMLPEDY